MTAIIPLTDTILEACQRLGVSRSMIYKELTEGRLTAVKARGRTLITREAQDLWLASLPAANFGTSPA